MEISVKLFVVSVLSVILLSDADRNPCHNDKEGQGRGVTCEKVVFPRWLCANCRLKPPTSNGNFQNCRSIYDITAPKCKHYLKLYAGKNKHCDPVRYKQTRNFADSNNVQGLDYFVYSMCEQCCDCVPRGAKNWQYAARQKTGTLMDARRGNCVAHAYYDVCKVLPKVRYLIDPGDKFTLKSTYKPVMCPLFVKWMNRKENRNWIYSENHYIDPPIKRFFDNFFDVANCRNRKVWQSCTDLEEKQGRL